MKRYWKLISIVALVVLTIGTFYIQQSMAKSSYPHFEMKKKSGDESEIKPLEIDAFSINEGIWANLVISTEGTKYREDLSIVNEVFENYREPEIKRLQNEHRHFMRGKAADASKYYEDDKHLIYANIDERYGFNSYEPKDFKFEIAVLDKDSNDKSTFKLLVPNHHQYHYMYVEDVQFVNGELLVVTHNNVRFNEEHDDSNDTEMHVYSFDIAEEKLLKDEIIEFQFPVSEKENTHMTDMFTISNEDKMGPNTFILFTTEIREERMIEEGIYSFEPIDFNMFAYNFETKEQVKLDLPQEVKEGYHPESVKGNHVYLRKNSDSQIDIMRYNVETKEIDVKQTFDQPPVPKQLMEQFGGIPGGTNIINDDKLYYVSPYKTDKDDAIIFVGDIETGNILYEGSIELAPDSAKPDKYQVELSYMRLK